MTQLKWYIPENILSSTELALKSKNLEVFVIWTANNKLNSKECRITNLIMPKQDSHLTLRGAYVHIDGKELSRINFNNYKNKEKNVVQIHTHPSSNVEMSELDIEWEVVNHTGALSIIVPNYCKKRLGDFSGVNIYEKEIESWRLWTKNEFKRRFIII